MPQCFGEIGRKLRSVSERSVKTAVGARVLGLEGSSSVSCPCLFQFRPGRNLAALLGSILWEHDVAPLPDLFFANRLISGYTNAGCEVRHADDGSPSHRSRCACSSRNGERCDFFFSKDADVEKNGSGGRFDAVVAVRLMLCSGDFINGDGDPWMAGDGEVKVPCDVHFLEFFGVEVFA
jgi:hypothetical protein